MRQTLGRIAHIFARASSGHPWRVLGLVALITLASLPFTAKLQLKTNVVDMLPEHSPAVRSYLEVTERFGEANTIVVLKGSRDSMVAAAEWLIPRLESLDLIYNVQGTVPTEWFFDHGLILVPEKDLDRTLKRSADPNLIGFLRGINDDFEAEYTDSEENMRDDEVEIATSMHGIQRSLEILQRRLAGEGYATMAEAADAMVVGEPWMLSLDRRMMIIPCVPLYPLVEIDPLFEMVAQVKSLVDEASDIFPDVHVALTGNAPLQQDEMDAMAIGTQLLTAVALLLIYLLLARTFGGWVLPLVALTPLLIGILWTAAVLQIVFGALNLFTAMIMLILLGLGIDFSIHLITRFYEERGRGRSVTEALVPTLGGSGVGVLTGGLTTAAAFLALLVGETKGVSELGFAVGSGIALTLLAVFMALPPLLVLRGRRRDRKGTVDVVRGARDGWAGLGKVAALSWRRPGLFGLGFLIVAALSLWAGSANEFELDWLALEPRGLENVELQREIPERFGSTTEGAWAVVGSVAEAREMKDRLEDLDMVAEVSTISDVLPPEERYTAYAEPLAAFERRIEASRYVPWTGGDSAGELAAEIERLWDNLDLMSNLAFAGGLDRIVRSLDRLTGYDTATDATDESAPLPSLVRLLDGGIDHRIGEEISREWYDRMRSDLLRMAGTERIRIEDLPAVLQRSLLPRDGAREFLVNISARDYLWHQDTLRRFARQMDEVDPTITGTPQMTLEFLALTGRDGRNGLIVAFLVIVVLLLITFRGPAGLLALIPLTGGSLMMLGAMYVFGMKYNFMNFMAIPVILGIGIDDGIHALHRFKEEPGEGSERVYNAYRFVGRAILLTTLTTMIGFGSLGFYNFPSIASFGIVLFFGVGACFVATVLFLPAFTRLLAGGNLKAVPVVVGTVSLALLSLFTPLHANGQETGADWILRIQNAEQVEHSYGVMRQTITTSTGAERTFLIRAWSAQEGDVSLMAYVDPARVAGDRILQLNGGDDIWYYMKRRDTTRHFAGHTRRQNAMGSDFSYEDMASGDFSEDYTAEILGYEEVEGTRCVKLKCTPTPSGPSYDYIILWAGNGDALTRRIEYYDEGAHLKTLFISEFQEIEGRTVAMRMEMVSQQKDSRTLMETVEMTFAAEPDPSLFTQAGLTRPLPPTP